MKRATTGLAALLVAAAGANADLMTFFGEDLGLGEGTPLAASPNADSARSSFLANLTGVGTENFESFAAGSGAPLAANFGVAGTATLNGTGFVANTPAGTTNGFGRYAKSGTQYWDTNAGVFSIDFSAPIAAFGFYGIDVGDFNGSLTLELMGGGNMVVDVANTVGSPGGTIIYFGLIQTDPGMLISSITFGNTAPGTDVFAFDDFTIGSREQVTIIPLPGAAGMGLAGLGVLAIRRRRA